jgi:hypothetical protein
MLWHNCRKVCLVGRRGPAQAACAAKELREIGGHSSHVAICASVHLCSARNNTCASSTTPRTKLQIHAARWLFHMLEQVIRKKNILEFHLFHISRFINLNAEYLFFNLPAQWTSCSFFFIIN